MSTFAVDYYDGCLFAAGLAVAAVVRFEGARLKMLAASAPIFLMTLLLLLGRRSEVADAAFPALLAASFLFGLTGFVLSFTYHAPDERRRALAASFLLGSPALLAPVAVLFGANW